MDKIFKKLCFPSVVFAVMARENIKKVFSKTGLKSPRICPFLMKNFVRDFCKRRSVKLIQIFSCKIIISKTHFIWDLESTEVILGLLTSLVDVTSNISVIFIICVRKLGAQFTYFFQVLLKPEWQATLKFVLTTHLKFNFS